MLKKRFFCRINCKDIMTKNPKLIQSNDMVVDALNILEDFSITQLVVVDHDEYKGVYIYMTFKRRNSIMAKKIKTKCRFRSP
jgi:predicted transcriptional regulator